MTIVDKKKLYYTQHATDMVNNNTPEAAPLDKRSKTNLEFLVKSFGKNYVVGGDPKFPGNSYLKDRQGDINNLKSVSSDVIFDSNDISVRNQYVKYRPGFKFNDEEFPASRQSLIGTSKGGNNQKLAGNLTNFLDSVTWKRISEIDTNIKMVVDGIKPEDIIQGALFDAYFLSAVAAVAEYQSRIRRLLISKEFNKDGIYHLAINKMGVWEMITIDDQIPIMKDEKGKEWLLGGNTADNEIWVALLEKAYLKTIGSYENGGTGGNVAHALSDLTGAPTEIFYIDEFEGDAEGQVDPNYDPNSKDLSKLQGKDKLWRILKNADIDKHIVCAATKNSLALKQQYYNDFENWSAQGSSDGKLIEDFVIETFGLYPAFCYTFLGISEYNGEKLVRLRNSKGKTEWKGDWGDLSEKWINIRKDFRAKKKADGIFYMPMSDFINMFDFACVNYHNETHIHSAFTDTLTIGMLNCYELEVRSPGKFYITVHQMDRKNSNNRGIF